ncbi:MAG TPA: TM2 domain-containing protein [Candidatus Limiplasma sp.]|nr:TM2 domain-containing protein [Candidatus Limiplasma sp.]
MLLCTFVGVFGFHRFYVGKIGSGVAYLLTGSWFGIGWLVDMISILTGHFRDCEGLRLAK